MGSLPQVMCLFYNKILKNTIILILFLLLIISPNYAYYIVKKSPNIETEPAVIMLKNMWHSVQVKLLFPILIKLIEHRWQ